MIYKGELLCEEGVVLASYTTANKTAYAAENSEIIRDSDLGQIASRIESDGNKWSNSQSSATWLMERADRTLNTSGFVQYGGAGLGFTNFNNNPFLHLEVTQEITADKFLNAGYQDAGDNPGSSYSVIFTSGNPRVNFGWGSSLNNRPIKIIAYSELP